MTSAVVPVGGREHERARGSDAHARQAEQLVCAHALPPGPRLARLAPEIEGGSLTASYAIGVLLDDGVQVRAEDRLLIGRIVCRWRSALRKYERSPPVAPPVVAQPVVVAASSVEAVVGAELAGCYAHMHAVQNGGRPEARPLPLPAAKRAKRRNGRRKSKRQLARALNAIQAGAVGPPGSDRAAGRGRCSGASGAAR